MSSSARRRGIVATLAAVLVFSFAPSTSAEQTESSQAEGPLIVRCSPQEAFWRRVAALPHRQYCGLVSRARASIWSPSSGVDGLLAEAFALDASGREAYELRAIRHLVQGEPRASHLLFEEVFSRSEKDAGAVPTTTRLAAARAALLSESYQEALSHYRWVALALDDVAERRERARLLIEAATAASYVSPPRWREARAYLAESARHLSPLLGPLREAALVLLFSRQRDERATPWSSEHAWNLTWILERVASARGAPGEELPVLPKGETEALQGVVTPLADEKTRRSHFSAFLKTPGQRAEHLTQHAQDQMDAKP